MTDSSRRRSRADRAIGPMTFRSRSAWEPGLGGTWPRWLTSPQVGLWLNTPQKLAGTRRDPPMSDPISSGVTRAASAAAAPPDEPPGVRLRSQGLFVAP